ncbi:hypothetical protein GCM10010411_75540 [Actinomadura fulvescens]|uniref:Uncharacterized protein n=1 Tax=Actinomadura fulvescens TaxID=46160 RepID=A0ABN3QIP4_9ACTN
MSSGDQKDKNDPLPDNADAFNVLKSQGRKRRPRPPQPSEPPSPGPAPATAAVSGIPSPAPAMAAEEPMDASRAAPLAQPVSLVPSQAPEPYAPVNNPQPAPLPHAPAQPAAQPQQAVASDEAAELITPTTALVGRDVALQLEYFQQQQRDATGITPTITQVVLDALNHCYGRYNQLVERWNRPAQTENLPFPGTSRRRRPAKGSRLTEQLPLRCTVSEMRQIDHFVDESQAKSRSQLIEVVLTTMFTDNNVKVPKSFRSKRGGAPAAQ